VEAKKVFDEAQVLLKKIMDEKLFRAVAQLAFYPANSMGDDIYLYRPEDDGCQEVAAVFYGLRQQAEKEPGADDPYACLSDFVAPSETGVRDYVGCFACSCFGAEELVKK
jgi:5-methyltetrahydrofolate--homocysteine methyltransferase